MNEMVVPRPNNLDAFWMPFSDNRYFKAQPRMLVRAEGMSYFTPEGQEVLDATAGLWCCNAGHGRREITEAIQRQAAVLDFAPTFQLGHPLAFEAAARLAEILPEGLDRIFWTNSGSESADTALKIALAYHKARGEGGRTRLIGRERGYHGVGFGGMSVGGIGPNRKQFGALLPHVDHLPHTHGVQGNRWSRGQPEEGGAARANALESLVALHGAETIAAVMVEPVAGSTGVLVPPRGYLERLREICTRHGILLIFDEVITGFGRLGMPFGAERLGVVPDIMTLAKGLTNAAVPMGAVAVKDEVYRAVTEGVARRHRAVPRLHLFGPPARGRRGHRHHGAAPRRGPCGPRAGDGRRVAGGGARHARPAARDRRPRLRADRRDRDGVAAWRGGPAGARRVPPLLRRGRAREGHRRHRRAVAAADHGEAAPGPDLRHPVGRDPGGGLGLRNAAMGRARSPFDPATMARRHSLR